jgi:aspartate kinase
VARGAAFRPTFQIMALIVHKYGGTSMGSTERIRNVAKRVAKWARAGHQMVVVPSAMSGETNRLLGLAKELAPSHITRDYCASWTCWPPPASRCRWACWPSRCRPRACGRQLRRLAGADPTDSAYTKARIESIDDASVRADLAAGKVVIITGFQGVDETATSPRWAAAAPTPRPWPWPRR